VIGSFKGELCRCYRLCTTTEQAKKEIDYTLDLFEDNGHNRAELKKIADDYQPHSNVKNKKDKEKEKNHTNVNPECHTKELFRALPFRCEDDVREEEEEEQEQKMFACIPYIPEAAHPLRRVLSKAGVNTIFSSGQKLQNILCGKNKTRPPPEKKKGVSMNME